MLERLRAPVARLVMVVVCTAATMPVSLHSNLKLATAAPILFSESFTGRSTTGWIAGGKDSACLTAGYESGGIPGCEPGTAGGVTGTLPDPVGNGALRLTRAAPSQAGYVIYNSAISTLNGLDITFDYYSYGGTGGDGMSFMLIDSAANPTATGGAGGSLGYSPLVVPIVQVSTPGIAGGYLAVGLDEYGNFVNNQEGRDVGCPSNPNGGAVIPNAVTARGAAGPAGGISLTPSYDGYCFLATSGALTQSLDVDSSVRTTAGLRRVRIVLDINRNLEVSIDFGSGFVPMFAPLNLAAIPGQPALPASVKLAFAASTGGRDNVHEVRNLVVRADRIGVRMSKVHLGDFVNGQTGQYRLTLVNNGTLPTLPGSSAFITDTLPAGLTYVPGSCAGTGWTCSGSGNTVTASYSPGPGNTIPAEAVLPPLDFAVSVNAAQALVTNTASGSLSFVSGSDTDVAVDPTAILAPDLDVDLTLAPATPLIGRPVTFTANLRNLGTYTATNVSLAQNLSGPLTVLSVTGSGGSAGWTCTAAPNPSCTSPALGLLASAQMTVVALVDSTAITGTLVGSQVTAASSTPEIGLGANSDSVSAGVRLRNLLHLPIVGR